MENLVDSKAKFDLRFESSNLDYSGIHVHIASEAMVASKQPEITSVLGIELSDLNYLCLSGL